MAALIDSSVLVAYFNDEDALHGRARELLPSVARPLCIYEYVVLETATVLMTRASKSLADSFIRVVFGNADFQLIFSSEISFVVTTETFLASRSRLSFTDAALLALSREYDVVTFDKALERAIKRQA